MTMTNVPSPVLVAVARYFPSGKRGFVSRADQYQPATSTTPQPLFTSSTL